MTTTVEHRRIVAAGRVQRNSMAIVTHKEGGGMEVLSTMNPGSEVRLASMPRETMTQLIARARAMLVIQ